MDDFGEMVDRATWIKLAQDEVDAAQARLDKVPEYQDRFEEFHPGGKHRPPPEDVEEWRQWWEAEFKRRQADKERHNAEVKAWYEVKLAEKGLKLAQSDDIGEKVEKATLIRLIQEEIESAQTRLNQVMVEVEKVRLRGNLLTARNRRADLRGSLKRHISCSLNAITQLFYNS